MTSRWFIVGIFVACMGLLALLLFNLGFIAVTGADINTSVPLFPTPTPVPCPGVPDSVWQGGPIDCPAHCDSLRLETTCDCLIDCALANKQLRE